MQKEKIDLFIVIDRIKDAPSSEIATMLQEAVDLAMEIAPCLPGVFVKSRYQAFDDMERLLCKLPNKLNNLYNSTEKRIFVFTSDISEARMGYEAVRPQFLVSLRSAMKDKDLDAAEARAVFLYIPTYERADFLSHAENAILLNPSRFSSVQLTTAANHFAPACVPLLWEAYGTKFDALAEAVRRNDKAALEYLLARMGIEASEMEKDRQLRYILSFLEIMTGRVDDGKE